MLQLQIIGNLGRDAEVRSGNRGKYVTFSVADTHKYKDSKGIVVSETTWVSCTLNNDGGALLPYLRKGVKVFASGACSVRKYQRSTGEWEFGLNMSVRDIELCGGGEPRPMQQQQQASDFAVGQQPVQIPLPDNDAPFPPDNSANDLPY